MRWLMPSIRGLVIGVGTGGGDGSPNYTLLFVYRGEGLFRARPGGHVALLRRLIALDHDLEPLVGGQTSAGGDEPPHDHVLLEAAEVVRLAANRRLGEDLGRLLERRGADERLGRQARLGDAEEQRLG